MGARLESLLERQRFVAPFILALGCILVWGATVSYDFVWDDRYFIVDNQALASPQRTADLFTREDAQAATSPEYPSWGVYRPLRLLHHAVLVWAMGRPVPAVFHAANVAWHLLACVLLYLLLVRILSMAPATAPLRRTAALLAALAFAVHPVVSEVVAWSKCLDDIMAAALFLGAVLAAWEAWIRYERPQARFALLSLGLHAAALLCKESVVALFPVFLAPLLFRKAPRGPFALWFGAQAALPALFVLARHGVLHSTAQVTTPLSGTHGQTLVDMLAVPLLYARTMLGIPPFLPDYSFMRGGSALLTPANLAGLLLLTGTAVLFLWGVWRRGTHGAVALGLGWLGLALFPVSNLVPMMQYFAERFVYLPLVGALIAGAGLLSVLAARRPKVVPAAAALVAVWAVVATGESAKWRNEQTLIFHAYHNSPPARRIVSNYLTVLDRAGDDRGIEEALARHPDLVRGDADLQWLVGRIRTRQGRLEEARRWLEPLTETLGRKPEYLLDLGIFHAQSGDTARARRLFTRVTREWPTVPRGWTCLGLNLSGSGSYSAAIPALRNAVRLNPNDVFAWKALARAALKRKDWALSRTALARLAQLDPADGRHAQLLKKMPRAP